MQRAIRSVLNQTHSNFQVCVYDNASGDETGSIVAEFGRVDPRVKYHRHRENIGALPNFVFGMKNVATPFFSFLSDDDILLPGFYEAALNGFAKYPRAIFSATDTLHIDGQGTIMSIPTSSWAPGLYCPPDGLVTMLKHSHPTWTGILFRRQIIEKVGTLNQDVGSVSDLDYELRSAARCPFAILRKPGAIFVAGPESFCVQSGLYEIWPGWLKMIRNLTEDEEIPRHVRDMAKHTLLNRLKRRLFFLGCKGNLEGNYEEASKVARILYVHFGQKVQALFISAICAIFQCVPPFYHLSVFVNKGRKVLMSKARDGFQNRYNFEQSIIEETLSNVRGYR